MTNAEYILISQYAASELAGALMLGKFARKTKIPYLRSKYIWHCAEEARHSWMWAELLEGNSEAPAEIHDEQGDQYFTYFKDIENDIDFLAFVHVYEMRVPFHLAINAKMKNVSEPTRKLMYQLIKEEGAHLSWVSDYLKKEHKKGNVRVVEAITKFGEIEEKTYSQHVKKLQHAGGEFKELGDLLAEQLSKYGKPWQSFLSPAYEKEEEIIG